MATLGLKPRTFDVKFSSSTAYCGSHVFGHMDQGRTLAEFGSGCSVYLVT